MGDSDHPPSGDLERSAGVQRTSAGARGGPDAGSATNRSGSVPSSRPHGDSVEEEDPCALQAGLQHTLADPVACFPSTASTDSDVRG